MTLTAAATLAAAAAAAACSSQSLTAFDANSYSERVEFHPSLLYSVIGACKAVGFSQRARAIMPLSIAIANSPPVDFLWTAAHTYT